MSEELQYERWIQDERVLLVPTFQLVLWIYP